MASTDSFIARRQDRSCLVFAPHTSQIFLRHAIVESHNALAQGETYHAMLRRIFNKAKVERPKLNDEILLSLAVKAMNDTAGPDRLVPTLLVFFALPRTVEMRDESPPQKERLRALHTAKIIQQIDSKFKIQQSCKQETSPIRRFLYQRMRPYICLSREVESLDRTTLSR